jgi:cation transport ATPase
MRRIRESVAIVAAPNAAGLALSTAGAIGPVAATALNNGASVAACLNALRPLLRQHAATT